MSEAASNVKSFNPLFDKDLLNAFVEGVLKTLSLMAQTEVRTGKPSVQNSFKAKGEIAGMVGMVAGTMKGTMSISYPKGTILTILENMLGERYPEINEEVADAVGEMSNQIYGTAKTLLNEKGYAFQMAIPTVVRGTFTISKYHNGATLVIPFILKNNEEFYVEITVQTSA